MFERIRDRYRKNYIRDDQLERYVALGVITREQADSLIMEKSGGGYKNLITLRLPGGTEVRIREG